MVNETTDILSSTYNVTSFTDTSIIDLPVDWLYYLDSGVGHFLIIGLLVLFGVAIYFGMKAFINSETESLMYTGFVCSFFGLLLFLARTSFGEPLLSFGKLAPFVIITVIGIYLNMVNRRF